MPFCEALRSYGGGSKVDKLRAVVLEYAQSLPWLEDWVGPLVRVHARTQLAPPTLREAMPSETITFLALSRLLEALENGEPVVLFVDDIQWLDASSTAFLGYLASQLHARKVFLILAHRSNGHIDDNVRKLIDTLHKEAVGSVHELSIPALARPEQRELIEALLGTVEFNDDEFDLLDVSAQANPYYLRELIQLLDKRGTIAQSGGVWRFVERFEPMLPPSRHQYVQNRVKVAVDGQPFARQLIYFAACAGSEFDASVLAACTDKAPLDVGTALQGIAERSGLVRRLGHSMMYRFDHDLTREAILTELGDYAPGLHGKLAAEMATRGDVPPSLIGHQFAAAGEQQKAATWYLTAARGASINAHFRSAVECCEIADRLLTEAGLTHHHAERIAVTTALGQALFGTERYTDVIDLIDDRVVGVPAQAAIPLLHILGCAEARVTDAAFHNRAVDHLSAALLALPEREEDSLRAKIYSDLVNAHDVCGNYPASESAYKMAVAAARRANDQPSQVRLKRLSCIFWQPEKVVEAIESAIVVAKRLNLDYELALCENNLGSAFLALRKLSAAHEHYSESDRLLRKLGGYRRDTPVNNLGVIKLFEGDIEASLVLLREALGTSADPHTFLFIQSNLAVVEAMDGNVVESLSRLQLVAATADASGDLFYRDCIGHNLANALVEIGRFDQALDVLDATPVHHSHGDEILVAGKRAALLIRALEGAGRPIPPNLQQDVQALHRSTKPQAWLYRIPWYLCEIEFWED
jgi:tetratricopeptide (TPR) repeat protein